MHELTELIFHAIIGLLRLLWAACEFVFQIILETGGDWLVGSVLEDQAPKEGVRNKRRQKQVL